MSKKIVSILTDSPLGGMVFDGVGMISSRDIAREYEKRHDNVKRDIRNIIATALKIEDSDINSKFIKTTYKDSTGRIQEEYLMTRDGFSLLSMRFTGEKALRFKIAYIQRFNEMEQFILSRDLARIEYPELTSMMRG